MVGVVTIGVTDYKISVPKARETLHSWIARVVTACETATGEDWSGWLSPDLELCLGCAVAFSWAGSAAGARFTGWADGAAPAATDQGYLLTGTASQAAERLCAVRLSWPILHAYRTVQVHPAASPVLVAAPYRAPDVEFDTELFVTHDSPAAIWTLEEWCYYRGTDTEVATYTDTDGWLCLRPIDEPSKVSTQLDGWAGTVTLKRRCVYLEA